MGRKVLKVEATPIAEVDKVIQPIGTKNVAGTQINPATEDTLSTRQRQIEDKIIYNVVSLPAPGSLWVEIQPPVGELWKVTFIASKADVGVAGARTRAVSSYTGAFQPTLYDVSDTNPEGKWEGELYINNTRYVGIYFYNPDTVAHNGFYHVSAVKVN